MGNVRLNGPFQLRHLWCCPVDGFPAQEPPSQVVLLVLGRMRTASRPTQISPSLLSWQFYLTSTPLKLAVLCHFLWPPFLLLLPDHKSSCGWAVLKARAAWQRGGSSAMSPEMGLKDSPAVRTRRALNPACRGHEPLNLYAHLYKHGFIWRDGPRLY